MTATKVQGWPPRHGDFARIEWPNSEIEEDETIVAPLRLLARKAHLPKTRSRSRSIARKPPCSMNSAGCAQRSAGIIRMDCRGLCVCRRSPRRGWRPNSRCPPALARSRVTFWVGLPYGLAAARNRRRQTRRIYSARARGRSSHVHRRWIRSAFDGGVQAERKRMGEILTVPGASRSPSSPWSLLSVAPQPLRWPQSSAARKSPCRLAYIRQKSSPLESSSSGPTLH